MSSLQLGEDGLDAAPRFAREADPAKALAEFATSHLEAGGKLVLVAQTRRELKGLARAAQRRGAAAPHLVRSWREIQEKGSGAVLALESDVDAGFLDATAHIAVIGAADLFGSRARQGGDGSTARADLGMTEVELRPSDAVIHLDHGMALLRGIETIAPAEGTPEDALQLEFADGAKLLVPAAELGKVWRYGAEAESVSLDKLNGATWPKRRAELEQDLASTAPQAGRIGAGAPSIAR
jgi:transcription-repair coupling factor (superfamily II helicase)